MTINELAHIWSQTISIAQSILNASDDPDTTDLALNLLDLLRYLEQETKTNART